LLKFARTEVSFEITTWQVGAVPEHPPLQLVNAEPIAGDAVNVTAVPSG